jgi:hypothetical protein
MSLRKPSSSAGGCPQDDDAADGAPARKKKAERVFAWNPNILRVARRTTRRRTARPRGGRSPRRRGGSRASAGWRRASP